MPAAGTRKQSRGGRARARSDVRAQAAPASQAAPPAMSASGGAGSTAARALQPDAKRARVEPAERAAEEAGGDVDGANEAISAGYKKVMPVGAGTYGTVYKASQIVGTDKKDIGTSFFAIKEFKQQQPANQELSLTALREIGLLRELHHENVIKLVEIFVRGTDRYSLSLVFEYAEYDFLTILRKHMAQRTLLPEKMVKSCMWQMLNGLHYIHSNWVVHRDMKPANVMVMGTDSICPGQVKIGDFGLARVIRDPAASLDDNGVVVTIWYRAPELLFMSKHYTTAIDIWAAGCIFGELLTCVPMFRGVEVPHAPGQPPPFQEAQVRTIFERLGTPSVPLFETLPMWKEKEVGKWPRVEEQLSRQPGYKNLSPAALDLLRGLLHYDPAQRLTAKQALEHKYFRSEFSTTNIFSSYDPTTYPKRPRYVPNQPPPRPPPKQQPQVTEMAQGQAAPQYARVGQMCSLPPPQHMAQQPAYAATAAAAQRGRGVGMQPGMQPQRHPQQPQQMAQPGPVYAASQQQQQQHAQYIQQQQQQQQQYQQQQQMRQYMQQQQQQQYQQAPPQPGRVPQQMAQHTQAVQYTQAHQQMPMPPPPPQMHQRQPRQLWQQQQPQPMPMPQAAQPPMQQAMQPQAYRQMAQAPPPPPPAQAPTRRRKAAATTVAPPPPLPNAQQAQGMPRGYAP